MEGADMARRQREQLRKYLKWIEDEGGVEGPTHLDTWFKSHQISRLRWLRRRCTGTIMELGCNYGYVLAYCKGQIGVDWNEKSIELARILNPTKEFVVADIRELPFPDGYVDTVLATDVLEHLSWEDVPKAIEEAKRVARLKVLVTMPNGEHDTPEATSLKHQFLLDRKRRIELEEMLKPWRVNVLTTYHFVLMEALKP